MHQLVTVHRTAAPPVRLHPRALAWSGEQPPTQTRSKGAMPLAHAQPALGAPSAP
ncbi:MAG: hypothetical protein KME45_18705 [Stenomitos rutilans HA7619-LM2]|nr:hypothetical protein [Stenomitos rutilans HA7619-LM2]